MVENNKAIEVQDSVLAKKADDVDYWYTLTTETNRIWIKNIEFYDESCYSRNIAKIVNKFALALTNKDNLEIEKWSKKAMEL